VIFLYQRRGRWGSVARGRVTPGFTVECPCFASAPALALSYVEPYVDYTGRVKAYAVVDVA
jgi:hypothetical protein